MYITSLANPRIKEVVKLSKNKKFRNEKQLMYFEGDFFLEFINEFKDIIETIYTTNEDFFSDEYEVVYVNELVFKKISRLEYSNGYVFITKIPNLGNEITSNKVLYLENISDPGNLGTILRTALAFNFTDVMLSENSVDIFNDKVIRASKGAIFQLNILTNQALSEVSTLATNGYDVIATTLGGEDINKVIIEDKVVVMFGSEGNGLSVQALELATLNVTIDMNEAVESLNVATAAAIILHKLK